MTAGVAVRLQKELRSLAWPWAASMASLGLAAVAQPMLAGLAAVPGALALGAWSVGSEYSQRTLPGLLVQPIPRWQLGLEKLVVVTVLMATLLLPAARSPLGWQFTGGVALASCLAASLAAVLTLKTRTPRSGILFTMAAIIVWGLFAQKLPEIVAYWWPELTPDPRWLARVMLTYGTLALTCATLAALLLTFARLEALEETHEHVSVLPWRGSRAATAVVRPAHPLRALAAKELGLQQVLLLVTVLYVLGWILLSRQDSGFRLTMVYGTTTLHAGVIALLAGAMASAEERRLGTTATQALLPVRFAMQWLVKVGVCVALVLGLAMGVPAILAWLDPTVTTAHTELVASPAAAIGLVALTVGALYVSSLSRNSLLAFLVAIPVCWAAGMAGGIMWSAVARTGLHSQSVTGALLVLRALVIVALSGFVSLILAFAMANHRAVDRPLRRVAIQGLSMLIYVLIAATVLLIVSVWMRQ